MSRHNARLAKIRRALAEHNMAGGSGSSFDVWATLWKLTRHVALGALAEAGHVDTAARLQERLADADKVFPGNGPVLRLHPTTGKHWDVRLWTATEKLWHALQGLPEAHQLVERALAYAFQRRRDKLDGQLIETYEAVMQAVRDGTLPDSGLDSRFRAEAGKDDPPPFPGSQPGIDPLFN